MTKLVAGYLSQVGRIAQETIHAFIEDDVGLNNAIESPAADYARFIRPVQTGLSHHTGTAIGRVELIQAIGK
jgi:hypothetical protein